MKKRSFFERLSGAVPVTDDYDSFEDEFSTSQPRKTIQVNAGTEHAAPAHHEEEHAEGQLPVDVYQTPSEIVVRTFVAGVRADEISLSLSRDMIVIEGSREDRSDIPDQDFFHRELFWGSFSRTIMLPYEVDVDSASATSKDGLLTLILPKLDKSRQTKLKVRAG